MKYPRIPIGNSGAAAPNHVACSDVVSDTQTIAEDGIYAFKVDGQDVYVLAWLEGSALSPATTTGLPLAESDGIVEFEVPANTKFRAICAAGQTARLVYWRSRVAG
jgi:hypothetical protein